MARITLEIDDDLNEKLQRVVQRGFRRHVLGGVLRLALNAIEKDGDIMIGALMAGYYKLVRDEPKPEDREAA